MLKDFKGVLARVQSDFTFYIECLVNPASALAQYNLSSDELSVLSNPTKLADFLSQGFAITKGFVITICGSHDWVNAPPKKLVKKGPVDVSRVATAVEAIRSASTASERTDSVVRLIELTT